VDVSRSTNSGGFDTSRAFQIAWLVAVSLGGYYRASLGEIPADMSAYFAAAEVFAAGADPYGEALFAAARYDGFPYVYPPGTLPLIGWLDRVDPALVVGADVILRASCLLGALEWLRRRILPDVPTWTVVLTALFYQPLIADFAVGNLAIYLLGAFVLCAHLATSAWRWWYLPAGVAAGVLLAFKPMWGLVAGVVLLANRRWAAAASVAAGAAVIVGLTTMHAELVGPWQQRIAEVRSFYSSFDLLALAPALLPVAILAWLAAGVALVRRGVAPERLWLWACVSLFAWPRLATYSYVLLIPVLLFLWARLGYRRALAISLVALGPLPWLLIGTADFVYLGLLYGWSLALAVVLFVILWREESSEDSERLGE
jgi:hypothetical protein